MANLTNSVTIENKYFKQFNYSGFDGATVLAYNGFNALLRDKSTFGMILIRLFIPATNDNIACLISTLLSHFDCDPHFEMFRKYVPWAYVRRSASRSLFLFEHMLCSIESHQPLSHSGQMHEIKTLLLPKIRVNFHSPNPMLMLPNICIVHGSPSHG